MNVMDCATCGGLPCQFCGGCHAAVCRAGVPACKPLGVMRSLASRDERWVYTLLFHKVAYLRAVRARTPATMAEVYEQQIAADSTVGVVLTVVARLLRPELRSLVEQLSEEHGALWNVERVPARPGLPPMVSKGAR